VQHGHTLNIRFIITLIKISYRGENVLEGSDISDAVQFFIETLQEKGTPIPKPLRKFREQNKGVYLPDEQDYNELPVELRNQIEKHYATQTPATSLPY